MFSFTLFHIAHELCAWVLFVCLCRFNLKGAGKFSHIEKQNQKKKAKIFQQLKAILYTPCSQSTFVAKGKGQLYCLLKCVFILRESQKRKPTVPSLYPVCTTDFHVYLIQSCYLHKTHRHSALANPTAESSFIMFMCISNNSTTTRSSSSSIITILHCAK